MKFFIKQFANIPLPFKNHYFCSNCHNGTRSVYIVFRNVFSTFFLSAILNENSFALFFLFFHARKTSGDKLFALFPTSGPNQLCVCVVVQHRFLLMYADKIFMILLVYPTEKPGECHFWGQMLHFTIREQWTRGNHVTSHRKMF